MFIKSWRLKNLIDKDINELVYMFIIVIEQLKFFQDHRRNTGNFRELKGILEMLDVFILE